MRVLVVNAGSSSLKLSAVEDRQRLATRTVERWDGVDTAALASFAEQVGAVDAVGHRVVHGGPLRDGPVVIDDALVMELDGLSSLAPLHQPAAMAGIAAAREALPGTPAVACFDTAFHRTMPPAASTYALPAEWNERWRLRRYGFHGLSHAYAASRAAELLGASLTELRLVSCHLGAGASLCAIRAGRSVDTTMGFTPLEGLVMATRAGSVDPGLLLWLLDRGVTAAELANTLEHSSGLAGLSRTSGDLRDVLTARARGSADADLAYDVFVHRLIREAGGMIASAGGLDVLVLTGGVGENSPVVRRALADGLAHVGVDVDADLDTAAQPDRDISGPGARVRTLVVAAGEDLRIAAEVGGLLSC